MISPSKLRLLVASLASAAAFFVVPAIGLVIGWSQMPYLNADGTPDNAPVRVAGVFILLSPVLFVLITAFAFFGGLLLRRFGQLKPKALLFVVVLLSVSAGTLFARDMPFGWKDALISFVAFAALVFVASGLSAFAWWKVAMRPNNTVERDGKLPPI